MKRLNFTQENWAKSIAGAKTVTRRCHDKPRYQVGDIVILTEPTQILETCPAYGYDLLYPWDETVRPLPHAEISDSDHAKLMQRTSGIYKQQPAMFMLQSFARHYVEVTEADQEPLQDISDEECIAEGVSDEYPDDAKLKAATISWTAPRLNFCRLWDSINGKKQGKRWGDNPTVFAYGYNYLEGYKP